MKANFDEWETLLGLDSLNHPTLIESKHICNTQTLIHFCLG